MKYLLFGHAGSANHGCEAIVRSTIKILGKNDYYLQSKKWQEDVEFGIDKLVHPRLLKNKKINRNSPLDILFRLKSRLSTYGYDDFVNEYVHKPILMKDSVALSIGGDNYCYYGIIHELRAILKAFRKNDIPAVLWGCSVDRNYIDAATIEDLKSYRLITARESETVQVLKEFGIEKNVIPCSDPAFTLDKQPTDVGNDFFESADVGVVGINVSDFMKYYNAYPDATLLNFKNLVDYILKETKYKIAFIPHVGHPNNNDLVPCKTLAKDLDTRRVWVAEQSLNCMQLKYLISRCKLFIGCRTHSTIAAYSTCVPTLVVGYSIKAKGICKDIFGGTENLLVDVRDYDGDRALVKSFCGFCEREDSLKERLTSFMPEYINRAFLPKKEIEKIKQ